MSKRTSSGLRARTGRVALLASAALILAACGSGNDDGTTTADSRAAGEPAASSTALPEASAQGGNLRVALGAEVNVDPVVGPRRGAYLWSAMLEPVVSYRDGALSKDGIVIDWERTTPTRWSFTIRDGVTFHDGTAVTGDQVARSIDLNREPESILAMFLSNVEKVEGTGDLSFEITTKQPQFNIPNLLNSIYLIPADEYEKSGTKGFNAKPIGTGPFRFKSARAGRDFIVEANPDYWGEAPRLDEITFTYAQDPAQRLALVSSDAADLAFDMPPGMIGQIESAGNLQLLQVPTALKVVVALDQSGDLADPAVRKAFAQSVNRQGIVEGLLSGGAEATGGLMNVLPSDPVDGELSYDIEAAKQALGGKTPSVDLTVPAGALPNAQEVGDAIAGGLEESGFNVNLKTMDYGTMLGQAIGGELTGAFIGPLGGNGSDPDFIFRSAALVSNCIGEDSTKIADEALTKDDAAAAAPLYDELNRKLAVDEPCYVPLYFQTAGFAAGDKVGGFSFSPLTVPDYSQAGFRE